METKNETHFLAIPLRGWILAVAFGLAATFVYQISSNGNEEICCSPTVNPTPNCHDWECRYVVLENDEEICHYIDSFTINADNSISFIAADGLITIIPFPHYKIVKNPNM